MRQCNNVKLLSLYLDFLCFYHKISELLSFPSSIPRLFQGTHEAEKAIIDGINRSYRKHNMGFTTIARRNGFYILLNPNDLTISPWISEIGSYDFLTMALISNIVRFHDVVVDVGANIGWFTLLAARLVGAEGCVIAFEPEPSNYSLLSSSISRNQLNNVQLINKCVSDSDGTQELFLSPESNPGAHSIIRNFSNGKITVDSDTLDSFASLNKISKINLLKIDVEGAEPMVLSGALALLRDSRIENLIFEWNPECWVAHGKLLGELMELYQFYFMFPRPPVLRQIYSAARLPRFVGNVYLRKS